MMFEYIKVVLNLGGKVFFLGWNMGRKIVRLGFVVLFGKCLGVRSSFVLFRFGCFVIIGRGLRIFGFVFKGFIKVV